MTVSAVSSSNSASSASSSSSSANSSAAESANSAYNTFLTVLTTELQNQDPLDPTDTSTFTTQLIGLAQVEQELNTNNTLTTMNTSLSGMDTASGVGYIGKSVTVSGNTAPLQNSSATWGYTLPSTAEKVTLTVTNSSGETVYTASGDPAAGAHTLTWNGLANDGTQEADGAYKLSVGATDASGNAITATTSVTATVTAVDSSSGTVDIDLGGSVSAPLTNITSVN